MLTLAITFNLTIGFKAVWFITNSHSKFEFMLFKSWTMPKVDSTLGCATWNKVTIHINLFNNWGGGGRG